MHWLRRAAGALVLAVAVVPAFAQRNTGAPAPTPPKAAGGDAMKLPAAFKGTTRITLPAIDVQLVDQAKRANTASTTKRLQIGIDRDVVTPAASSIALHWVAIDSGSAARWEVTSPGARALRIELTASQIPAGAEVRFMERGEPARIYGPFMAADLTGAGTYWSPILEGDTAVAEVWLPPGESPSALALRIPRVSHLFASPADRDLERQAKLSGTCEVDIICLSATDSALADIGKAVARMSYTDNGTFTCTGTLLNPKAGPLAPYFFSAAHCINNQPAASTLTTHWFEDSLVCDGNPTTVNPLRVQISGGALLLYANTSTDVSLMRLNNSPPAGAMYAGWDAATLGVGTALTAVHHPAADVKMVSLGTMASFTGTSSRFIRVNWNSTATGVTEGGSSGSGIFTLVTSPRAYFFRGGLQGGTSSCAAPPSDLHDDYSRFDQAYPALAQYLDPANGTCAYSLSATGATYGPDATTGSVMIAVGPNCPWTATSDSPWLTTSSSGSGITAVTFNITANAGSSRSGRITVAGQQFTVSQGAPASGNLLVNPGFESGFASWTGSAGNAHAFVTTDAALAHFGTNYARLSGYNSAVDSMYQAVTIPADATSASLRFWYRITSTESAFQGPFDNFAVTVANASTGATLATLLTLSNKNPTPAWAQTASLDLAAYRGQTVRIVFSANSDGGEITTFYVDDVTLTAPQPGPGRLGNISTRAQVLTGNDVMIAGFIIGGTLPKTVVVNVAGPSLIPFGIANALVNPTVRLVRSSDQAVLATNDNWQAQAVSLDTASIQATGFQPNNVAEPAIIATLDPGAYTAVVEGSAGSTGVGLVGVFEVDRFEVPLANISTRGQVKTGNDVMIAGFVIQGNGSQKVVINVAGPSLVPFGITNALANPTLSLVRQSDQVVLATNDNWQTQTNPGDVALIQASGFQPNHANEPAIIATLPAGAYTAIVSGASGGTGVGLVGVFTAP